MSDYILTPNGELYHYGVKGMKWGVRRSQKRLEVGAEKRAKKLSSLYAKSVDNTRSVKSSLKSLNKAKRYTEKMVKKYENTSLSDIQMRRYKDTSTGREYVQILMGRDGNSPYDGSERYRVAAGTWTR